MTLSIGPKLSRDFDTVSAVREATQNAEATLKKRPRFSLTEATPAETLTAVLFGIYLGYAVGRFPEVFPILDVPHLPMILMLFFLGILVLTVPATTWKRLWHESPAIRYVSALAALGIITAPIGLYTYGSIFYFRTRYVIALAVFFCSVIFLRDRRNMRRAIAIFVFAVGAVCVNTLATFEPDKIQYDEEGFPIDQAGLSESERVYVGVSLDPNDFGAILAVTLPLALWLGFGGPGRRILWSTIAVLFCATVVLTASRGALLGFGAVATVLIGIGARGWRRGLTIVMVCIGAAAFVFTASSGQSDRMTDFSGDDYNLTTSQGRWSLWKQGIIWTIKRPWGHGLDNFPFRFEELFGDARAAHSTWVQYAVELGVAGLAAYILLAVALIRGLLLLRKRAIREKSVEEEVLAGHLVAMLTGLYVTGSFLSNAYSPLTYMPIGIAAAALLGTGLAPLVKEEEPAPVPKSQVQRRVRAPLTAARRR